MAVMQALMLLALCFFATAQRPSFAGFRPIGYPELLNKTTTPSGLQDKFGEGTTQRLPVEALGDRDLVDRLSKLPIDKQPFWFINWQALEAQRGKPQTYPQRPNQFLESNFESTNNQLPNQNTGSNTNTVASAVNNGNSNSGSQSQSPKVQDTLKPVGALDIKNGNSNVDNRYGTESSTAGATIGVNSNNRTAFDNPKPVTRDSEVQKPIAHPTLTPNPDKKDTKESIIANEENEFEDIQVKKVVKKP